MGLSPPAPQMTEWVVEEANTPPLIATMQNKQRCKLKKYLCKSEKVALVIFQMILVLVIVWK